MHIPMYVGWDWAAATHDVTVLDDAGQVVARWPLSHDEAGITSTLARLARLGGPESLPVAIEATHSLVIDRLLAAGHPVVPIHPNSFHAARPRWGASKAKSDPGDSFKLADYLRTDGHRLRRLEPLSAAATELRALTRARDDYITVRVAATNQLRTLLERHWPGATRIFAHLDSQIALVFLDDYPTPAAAARLGEQRIAKFCQRHAYSGRRTPAELLARLREAPEPTEAISPRVLAELVRIQVRHLRSVLAAIADLDRAITAALDDQPKAALLAPMPRIGTINLAQIVAEIGPILHRTVDLATPARKSASFPSPAHPASRARSASAGRSTPTLDKPSAASPTTAATARPGPPTSTNDPAPAANAIPTPSASSPAPVGRRPSTCDRTRIDVARIRRSEVPVGFRDDMTPEERLLAEHLSRSSWNGTATYRSTDDDSVASTHTPDAISMPANHPALRGVEEIARWYRERSAGRTMNVQIDVDTVEVVGDIAIVVATFRVTRHPEESVAAIDHAGRWLAVYKRCAGMWKLWRDMDTPRQMATTGSQTHPRRARRQASRELFHVDEHLLGSRPRSAHRGPDRNRGPGRGDGLRRRPATRPPFRRVLRPATERGDAPSYLGDGSRTTANGASPQPDEAVSAAR